MTSSSAASDILSKWKKIRSKFGMDAGRDPSDSLPLIAEANARSGSRGVSCRDCGFDLVCGSAEDIDSGVHAAGSNLVVRLPTSPCKQDTVCIEGRAHMENDGCARPEMYINHDNSRGSASKQLADQMSNYD